MIHFIYNIYSRYLCICLCVTLKIQAKLPDLTEQWIVFRELVAAMSFSTNVLLLIYIFFLFFTVWMPVNLFL